MFSSVLIKYFSYFELLDEIQMQNSEEEKIQNRRTRESQINRTDF